MTTQIAPERSHAQRMAALGRANEIRSYRAQLKVEMKGGRRSAVDVLADPDEAVRSMAVFELLLAMPKVGRVKVNKILSQCRISPSKTIGGLSERQRREIRALLRVY